MPGGRRALGLEIYGIYIDEVLDGFDPDVEAWTQAVRAGQHHWDWMLLCRGAGQTRPAAQ